MSHPINSTATRDIKCTRCRATIVKGERLATFRERALSHAEACHAGTMYPKRMWCAKCAAPQTDK